MILTTGRPATLSRAGFVDIRLENQPFECDVSVVRRHPRHLLPGFTLIEVSLAIVIVGTGCVAAMMLFASVSQQNATSRRLTVASQLVRHLEEAMAHLSYDDPITRSATFGPETGETLAWFNDLDDFNDFDSSGLAGPIDALRQPIPELDQYRQSVDVVTVDPNTLAQPGIGALRVDVTVHWRATPSAPEVALLTTSWYRTP
jgi:prepilin-type N-terminal cleavage/methylation domain-containing protein